MCYLKGAAIVMVAAAVLGAERAAYSKAPPVTLTGVSVKQEGKATVIVIETSGKSHFTVAEIEEPRRIFIDVRGADLPKNFQPVGGQTELVSKTLVEELGRDLLGEGTRVTLHLQAPARIEKRFVSKKALSLTLLPIGQEENKNIASSPAASTPPAVLQGTEPATLLAKKDKEVDNLRVGELQNSAATIPSAPQASSKQPKAKTVGSEDPAIYSFPREETASGSTSLPAQVAPAKKSNPQRSGPRIDLDFKDADIHNILRLLSEVGNVNIVAGDDVKGTVTISMKNVPWHLALDVILEAKGLGKVKVAENIYRVAPLATLEKEREMKIKELQARKILRPLITKIIPVSYAMAATLKPQVQELLSDRGRVSIDERTNVLIVRDVAENLSLVEQLVRNLDTQTPQVLIEARIVEASSTYSRELGIQWGGQFIASTATGNPTGIVFPNSVILAGGGQDDQTPTAGMNPFGTTPNPNFAVNLPAMVGTGAGGALGISLGSVANNANLNLRLSALENDGIIRIISAPKILTLDNKEALIEQGTLIPYSQVSAQGVQTAFQEAKLSLQVTPHVTADGSILLRLFINRDEPDFTNRGARGDPTILKRHAKTELLIDDGKTAVIGGIYTRNYGNSFNQVPFFAKIPIIGWLFKKRTDTDRRSELLIFITPRIVNRAESLGK